MKTSRLLVLLTAVVATFTLLTALNATLVALYFAVYSSVYLVLSYSVLRSTSQSTQCKLERTELELGEKDVALIMHLVVRTEATLVKARLYLGVPPQLSDSDDYSIKSVKLDVGKERIVVKFPLSRRTGLHVLGPLRVVITDVLEVFEVQVYYLDSIVVKIPPKIGSAPIARWYGIIRSSSGARTLSPGVGVEYHSTREYRPEDELRYVDWKATARLSKLHVKVFEVETPIRVFMVLDAHRYMFIGNPKSLFEYSSDLALALSNYLVKRGDRLVLAVISEDGIKRSGEIGSYSDLAELLGIVSSIRWPHRTPILREEPSRATSLRSLHIPLKEVSAVVIFTPIFSTQRISEILELNTLARESGVRVVVATPIVTFFSTTSRVSDTVYRALRFNLLSREIRNVELLKKSGIHVVALSPHKTLERVILDLEKIRATKTR
ncbi:MAG: DUF58 domain-containing protein [Sulfolobales archaeon]|nr:DUF58 domain-containing protein [Sulfolobales archaeon]